MKRLPKTICEEKLTGCFLAGGAILSTITKQPISDYDIYPKTEKDAIDIIHHLTEDADCYVEYYSSRAITFCSNTEKNFENERMRYQVMIFDVFPTAEYIFKQFDFSVCMAALDMDTKEYIFHDDFWPDVASKTLHFNQHTKFPLASLIRVAKYNKKGYFLPKAQMIKMGVAVSQSIIPDNWGDFENIIGGFYGKVFTLSKDISSMECNLENIYTALDSIENTNLYLQDFDDPQNLFELFNKGNYDKYQVAYKILRKQPITVIKMQDAYHYYDVENKMITDIVVKETEHNNVIENILCEGFIKITPSGDGKTYSHSPTIYSTNKIVLEENSSYKNVLTLNSTIPENEKNSLFMSVLFDSNDIIKISRKNDVYKFQITRFRTLEIHKPQ